MKKTERENWLRNIQNTTNAAAKEFGWETVKFIFQEYGGGMFSNESQRLSCCESVWNMLL